jgi:type I restriction enzyme S subunit
MQNINVPHQVNILKILGNKVSLSPHNYRGTIFGTTKTKQLKGFLTGDLIKGEEVGSNAYISKSHKFFIRNKALQTDSFTFNFIGDSVTPILPDKFVNLNLREGDLIISKDSNVGEIVILDKDYPDHMLSGGLIKISVEPKYYLFAFLKNELFRTQLKTLISKGATIQHAKRLFLNVLIPLPIQQNTDDVYSYFEALVRIVVNKEKQIRENERLILELIEAEMLNNQKPNTFKYHYPNIQRIIASSRIDAGFYCEKYIKEQFLISNYVYGSGTIEDWGFDVCRGQNLQEAAIGKSIYTDKQRENYYVLVRPTSLSDFGTVAKYEYLGNGNELDIISEGDIIFSAEGSIGKCVMFSNPKQRMITNIHGIVLNKKNHDKEESAFVACFLRYLRKAGVLDCISVGGQGGSLALNYLSEVKIPFFPTEKRRVIAQIYHNPTTNSGILELDSQVKILKERIDSLVGMIANGKEIEIDFGFLSDF